MITRQRKNRLRELDLMLRSEAGLNLRDAAKNFSVTDISIKADIDRLKWMIGPIVRSGRKQSLTYRYSDPIPQVKFEESHSLDDEERKSLAIHAARLVALQAIQKVIESLRRADPDGADWVIERLAE